MHKCFWLLFILSSIIVKIGNIECDDRSTPFLKEGKCYSSCTSNEVKEGQCEINNEIIKIQWINNIIVILDVDFVYLSIATSENNYLYFSSSSNPPSTIRKFYILDNEGSVSFIEKNLTIEERDQVKKGRYESELFLIKLLNENSNKEYLLSVSKAPQYIELYDFYENKVYFKGCEVTFGQHSGIFNTVWPILKLYSNNNQNIYLIGFSANENGKHYFYIKKVSFSYIDINNNLPNCEVTQKIECSESKSISCYKTNNNYIACFYDSNEFQYTMIVYDNDFNQKKTEVIYQSNGNDGYDKFYFKCIHFFGYY